ncbi:hypothetical protein [Streptomyces humidus]|uniref:hypothetical protein n=1 Tax=Streptomyces humidus TaxID=52259 RepID=UPI00331FA0DA
MSTFTSILAGSRAATSHAGRDSSVPFRARNVVVFGIVVICATLTGITAATADDPPQPPSGSGPPSAVEDFGYPGAGRILTDKGIKLKRGDGHILLADCDQTAQQIRVLTRRDDSVNRAGTYCFRALGKTGYLTLELPQVFAVEAADHPIRAALTANGQTTSVDVPKGEFESVGEAAGGAPSVLVELRVTG